MCGWHPEFRTSRGALQRCALTLWKVSRSNRWIFRFSVSQSVRQFECSLFSRKAVNRSDVVENHSKNLQLSRAYVNLSYQSIYMYPSKSEYCYFAKRLCDLLSTFRFIFSSLAAPAPPAPPPDHRRSYLSIQKIVTESEPGCDALHRMCKFRCRSRKSECGWGREAHTNLMSYK